MASRAFAVPRGTLQRHLHGKLEKPAGSGGLNRGAVFSHDQEQDLVNYILLFESRGFPLTVTDIRALAYDFAALNNIPHPFSDDKKKAGIDWWQGFR